MLISESEKFRRSVSLVDFNGGNEELVREEFLVPVFRSAGYGPTGAFRVARGVNLLFHPSSTGEITTLPSGRRHIYPDFVLFAHLTPLWVADAKSPRIAVAEDKNVIQLEAYLRSLKCKYGILSNAVTTNVYEMNGGSICKVTSFSIEDLISSRWTELVDLIEPRSTTSRLMSLEELIHNYDTENYEDRLYLMDTMRSYPPQLIVEILETNSDTYFSSSSIRTRSLPANLCVNIADYDRELYIRTITTSCHDASPLVRENAVMCALPKAPQFVGELLEPMLDRQVETPFESFLSEMYLIYGRRKVTNTRFVPRELMDLTSGRGVHVEPVEFPPALLVSKPTKWSVEMYYHALRTVPEFLEMVFYSDCSEGGTLRMACECIEYAARTSPRIFGSFLESCSKRQKAVLDTMMSSRDL